MSEDITIRRRRAQPPLYQIWIRVRPSSRFHGSTLYIATVTLARGRYLVGNMAMELPAKVQAFAVSNKFGEPLATLQLTREGWITLDNPFLILEKRKRSRT